MIIFHEFQLVQYPGEFVLSLTGGYHSGVSCGLNCAESVNFGSEKFLKSFDKFKLCQCPFSESENSPNQAVAALKAIVDVNQCVRILKFYTNRQMFSISIDLILLKFICNECGKSFGWKKNLNMHQKIQHAIECPRYVCPKGCGKTCTTSYNLKIHVLQIHAENMDLKLLKECNDPTKTARKLN